MKVNKKAQQIIDKAVSTAMLLGVIGLGIIALTGCELEDKNPSNDGTFKVSITCEASVQRDQDVSYDTAVELCNNQK